MKNMRLENGEKFSLNLIFYCCDCGNTMDYNKIGMPIFAKCSNCNKKMYQLSSLFHADGLIDLHKEEELRKKQRQKESEIINFVQLDDFKKIKDELNLIKPPIDTLNGIYELEDLMAIGCMKWLPVLDGKTIHCGSKIVDFAVYEQSRFQVAFCDDCYATVKFMEIEWQTEDNFKNNEK